MSRARRLRAERRLALSQTRMPPAVTRAQQCGLEQPARAVPLLSHTNGAFDGRSRSERILAPDELVPGQASVHMDDRGDTYGRARPLACGPRPPKARGHAC